MGMLAMLFADGNTIKNPKARRHHKLPISNITDMNGYVQYKLFDSSISSYVPFFELNPYKFNNYKFIITLDGVYNVMKFKVYQKRGTFIKKFVFHYYPI